MCLKYKLIVFEIFLLISCTFSYFGTVLDDDCFCQLHGKIDDCMCNVDTVDHFNNVKIYPRLRSLLHKGYFRFYKVNLRRPCPFWSDDSRCAMRYCHVEACEDKDIPVGLKGDFSHLSTHNYNTENPYITQNCNDHNAELSYLNTTISAKVQEDIVLWSAYDDAQDNFCVLEDNDSESEYVDLLLNPERYTGYKGKSAHRIWHSIYMENCFRRTKTDNPYIQSSKLDNLCLEERVFYRAISGLHASINVHLCAQFLLSDSSLTEPNGKWGHNLYEFQQRFSKETTKGEGPHWLRNLYFVYLLELRALNKAANYLEREEFYTGNETEDWDTQLAVKDLLSVVRNFPDHFNESSMFAGNEQAEKLKYEFKQHFRNVSKIMDCVGCDKCKLWGKLQTQGLGTALKILFSGKFDEHSELTPSSKKQFQLQRSEIVSLVNSIGRLSTSIYELDEFRHLLR
jgi:ERO1-like protein alpha